MLNPLSFISKIIKSSNQKELDRISKIVSKINIFEERKLLDSNGSTIIDMTQYPFKIIRQGDGEYPK